MDKSIFQITFKQWRYGLSEIVHFLNWGIFRLRIRVASDAMACIYKHQKYSRNRRRL